MWQAAVNRYSPLILNIIATFDSPLSVNTARSVFHLARTTGKFNTAARGLRLCPGRLPDGAADWMISIAFGLEAGAMLILIAQKRGLVWMALSLLILAMGIIGEAAERVNLSKRSQPFILGADVSWTLEEEAAGAKFYDHGVQKDLLEILKEHQFNYVRLRIFVNPSAPGGYAFRRREAFCDLEHTKTMARRVKAADMKFLLTFHLSDTWASPGHQAKPAAWAKLSFPDLVKAVHDHTYSVTKVLKDQGTTPDMAEIGNEISDGMLFPDGSIRHWDQFAALVKAGIAGVKEVDPSIPIMLHHHLGRSNSVMRPWLDNLIERGVQFDVIGMSCYAQAREGDWKTNFDDLAVRYPDKWLLVAEYSARKQYVNDLIYRAPNDRGIGSFIWEPTRHREAIFDKNGRNVGGAQASNFTTDTGTNQGAAVARRPATRPAAGFGFGGRYDANSLIDLYPIMAREYGD
jgi:arabinogalactan endo-1,4-beta-galactosidase